MHSPLETASPRPSPRKEPTGPTVQPTRHHRPCVHIQPDTRSIATHWGLPHLWLYRHRTRSCRQPTFTCERGPSHQPPYRLVTGWSACSSRVCTRSPPTGACIAGRPQTCRSRERTEHHGCARMSASASRSPTTARRHPLANQLTASSDA